MKYYKDGFGKYCDDEEEESWNGFFSEKSEMFRSNIILGKPLNYLEMLEAGREIGFNFCFERGVLKMADFVVWDFRDGTFFYPDECIEPTKVMGFETTSGHTSIFLEQLIKTLE